MINNIVGREAHAGRRMGRCVHIHTEAPVYSKMIDQPVHLADRHVLIQVTPSRWRVSEHFSKTVQVLCISGATQFMQSLSQLFCSALQHGNSLNTTHE